MEKKRPQIIVTNDDGIDAPGIATLIASLSDWAECRVVAPAGPQSGVGHSLTYDRPLEVQQIDEHRMAVHGTPADCARVALSPGSPLLEEWADSRRNKELWLISGINHGANLGMDLYPSGTAAAAREAALLGFRSIAISQYVGPFRKLDWQVSERRARSILRTLVEQPPVPQSFWNINLPHPPDDSAECNVVHCPPDPSPQLARYVRNEKGFFVDEAVYHDRPRLPRFDIDICFGGHISVSEINVIPETSSHQRKSS